ncbi:hypothetical protein ACGFY9_13910 [Streptomyces sp. NPDC048504]|uniref:hypothetical protein n=1 Tax=Streptomyces sp. NPDC048504 TaxID=3365559 RepID=UPI0037172626
MSLWVCLDCTAAYSVGAPLCPECGSERHAEEGTAAAFGIQHGVPIDIEEDDMPKITRHGGASVAGEEPAADEAEGGEDVSAGADTSTSSETPSEKPELNEKQDPSPARTTASRSAKGRTGKGSTAPSTDGGQTEATSETASADE